MRTDQVKAALGTIIHAYDEAISKAKKPDEIVHSIARFTQDLARLHPFDNANTRTTMLLLNKLLAENGLDMAIVDNPKHFYLNTVESWKQKIVAGMATWQTYVAARRGTSTSSAAPASPSASSTAVSASTSSTAPRSATSAYLAMVRAAEIEDSLPELEEISQSLDAMLAYCNRELAAMAQQSKREEELEDFR